MPDMLEALSTLSKAHDYFGKAKFMFDTFNKVKKAARINPADTHEFEKFVGIVDDRSAALQRELDDRVKATEAAADADYPAIPVKKRDKAWVDFAKAVGKHGQTSREAERARAVYLKFELAYEKEVDARILDAGIHAKQSKKQAKLYAELARLHATTETLCEKIIKLHVRGVGPVDASAFAVIKKYMNLGSKASKISKAHDRIVKKAEAEAAAMKKEKRALVGWLKDVKAKQANANLKRAFKALGVSV